ncbi:MAG: serine hydrolase domain-containing protein [Candidatus Fimadaptatus sp.]
MDAAEFERYKDRASEDSLNIYALAALDREGRARRAQIRPAHPTNDVYSVAKAYAVTGAGLAFDAGRLEPGQTVAELLGDELPAGADARWHAVTLDQLMRHRAGFGRGWLDIDVDEAGGYESDDYLALAMREPLVHEPGAVRQYTDAAYYIVSRIVERAMGRPLDTLLRPLLMGAMRYGEMAWSRCPRGHALGATGLFVRVEDMVKLGRLYADEGMWQGERVLSREWVRLCLERGYEFGRIAGGWYGKGGMYGQMLCFDMDSGCALAWQAHTHRDTARAVLGL